jgi:lipopolysaccharide transport system ATP-binding protein
MGDVASRGRTVLFVSHNMPAVKTLCKTAIRLDKGEVVDRGDAASVVDGYLRQSTTPAGLQDIERAIAELPEDPAMRLTGVRVMQSGHETMNLLNGERVEIEIRFEALATTLGLHVYFQLLDLEGSLLLESLHNGDLSVPPLVEAGRYVTTATIPANFLAPRPHELRILAGIHNVRNCFPDPLRITLDVQQSGIVNQAYPGYQSPARIGAHIEWVTQCLS